MTSPEPESIGEACRREFMKVTAAGLVGLGALSEINVVGASEAITEVSTGPNSDTVGLDVTLIEADPEAGFNFPYFLYAPDISPDAEPRPLLVQPNNSGTATDDFSVHQTSAEERITERFPRDMSDNLTIPLLVPVFPRPESDPVDLTHYVHYLCTTTMNLESGVLERVDQQLIRMVEHAQDLLADLSYPVTDDIHMNGFSASGNFVNRFAALHPERVQAVTAGAVNGTAILPLTEADGHSLPYQLGVADFDSLIGETFDLAQWTEVDQFIYMGATDTNDTIGYGDAWTDSGQEATALEVYGEDMQRERMPFCEAVYDAKGASAQFAVYDGVGHWRSSEISQDVLEFHERHLGVSQAQFVSQPMIGATAVTVRAAVGAAVAGDEYDVQVISDSRGSITEDVLSLEPDEFVTERIPLTDSLEPGEEVTLSISEADEPAQDNAVATAHATVAAHIEFVDVPEAGDTEVTVNYTLADSYEGDDFVSIRFYTPRGQDVLEIISPGDAGVETYQLDPSETGIPAERGEAVRIAIVDNDPAGEDPLAEATCNVPGVEFTTQPVAGDTTLSVGYTLPSVSDVAESASLRLHTDAGTTVLTELTPGDEATEEFTLDADDPGVPLEADTELSVAIVDSDSSVDDPIASTTAVVRHDFADAVEIEFVERPVADASELTVSYSSDEQIEFESLQIRVFDEDGVEVTESPVSIEPGVTGDAQVTLTGPVPQGDVLQAAILEDGEEDQSQAFASVDAFVNHPGISVEFAERPTADTEEVTIEYDIAEEYPDEYARLRVFPEDGHRWGIGLDWLNRGAQATRTYDLGTQNDGVPLAFGSRVIVRILPDGWGTVDDTLAEETLTVGGGDIELAEPPAADTTEVTVSYALGETYVESESAELRLFTDAGGLTVLDDIDPGETATRTYSVDPDVLGVPFDRGSYVTVALVDDDPFAHDPLAVDDAPVDIASVQFDTQPVAGDREITVSYSLDETYDSDEFVGLRLYTETGSAWGRLLTTVDPAEDTGASFELDPVRSDVPLTTGTTVYLAIVRHDDPYAEEPLAITATTVTETSEDHPALPYTNDEGVVNTEGLRMAIDDWRNEEGQTDVLRDVIDLWRSGEPLA